MRKFIVVVILISMLLVGCEETQITGTPPTPTDNQLQKRTATPSPIPTVTTAPHLIIDPQDLNGMVISFWHPWTGATNQAINDIVYDFNINNLWGIEIIPTSAGSIGALNANIEQNSEFRRFTQCNRCPNRRFTLLAAK